jgi:hypothetical protein
MLGAIIIGGRLYALNPRLISKSCLTKLLSTLNISSILGKNNHYKYEVMIPNLQDN